MVKNTNSARGLFTVHHSKSWMKSKKEGEMFLRENLSCSFSVVSGIALNYLAGLIAPTGQASAQVPQSAHISGLMLYLSPSEIAPTGHSSIQVPHAIQSSPIT
jgi:hypothetical protein